MKEYETSSIQNKLSAGVVMLIFATMGFCFNKVGTTAAQFLKIELGARAVAMGGSFVALANDPAGVYYNPAGLVELKKAYVSGGYTRWFADLDYNYATFVLPSRWVHLSLWGSFLSSGDMLITTVEEPEGTGQHFKYIDGLLGLSASTFLSDRLSIGISVKYIQQTLYHESASTFALDLGSILRTPIKGARLGMCLVNYGGRMQLFGNDLIVQTDPWPDYDGNADAEARLSTESFPLPLAFKLGVAFELVGEEESIFLSENNRLTILADGIHPNDGEEKLQIGCEYSIVNTLFLRGGYKVNYDTQRFTAGAGMKVVIGPRDIIVDYAYVDMDILDSTHRITLTIGF